jgi:membrane protease YdiL (CAAX protease family)
MHHVEQAVALAALVLLGIVAALRPDALPWLRVLLAMTALGAAALSLRHATGAGAAVALVVACLGLASAAGVLWQVAMLLALLVYGLVARGVRALTPRGWWAWGSVPWWPTALCAAVTPIALVSWVLWLTPDIEDLLRAIPAVSLPILLVGTALFVLVNATGEELIWRGLFQDRLQALFGPLAAILIQGVSFGAQHVHGFPRGLVGVCLAGLWGVGLGWLRQLSGGILAPLIAHAVADTTIPTIVRVLAQR